jgi:tRNA threonylcarbamoyladenosine biosynthesis protein TsaE
MSWPLVLEVDSPAATREVAARLSTCCRPGDTVLLVGDLGAGKTAFAQGFAAALGVEGPVTSPTFALVRQYRCGPAGPIELLIHADVYRTGSLGEVVELALSELVEERAVALVEWGDMAAPALGDDVLEVTLAQPQPQPQPEPPSAPTPEGRTIAITGRGGWAARADEVARVLQTSRAGSS